MTIRTRMSASRAPCGSCSTNLAHFIVVLKRGNHVPYYDNYPADQRHWAPAKVTASLKQGYDPVDWSQWVDSYDDGLRYNVDGFFRGLLNADGSLPGTVVLYTSDHGQPYYPETDADLRTAASVPLMMFGDSRPPADTSYRASHHNIFATLLDVMRVPQDQRPVVYGRSLLVAHGSDHDPRMVFLGDFTGREEFHFRDFDSLAVPAVVK